MPQTRGWQAALAVLAAVIAVESQLAWAAAPELNAVRKIDHFTLHSRETLIRIELDRPLARLPAGFRTFHPAPSVVLELPETAVVASPQTIFPERGLVRRVRLVGHAQGTRLLIELNAPATYEAALEGNAVLVTLRRTPPARAGERNTVSNLTFERGALGEARVRVRAGAMAAIDVRQQGRRLIVSFLDTRVEPADELRLDVLDFATPVETIEGAAWDATRFW